MSDNKKKKIQILYRNYIPLNSPYSSFWTHPPESIEFRIPAAKTYLKHFYPIYRKYGSLKAVRALIHIAQKFIFTEATKEDDADAYFYIGILPSEIPEKPFYIDIEHASALVNFLDLDDRNKQLENVMNILTNPMCKGIVPISAAAAESLKTLLGESYDEIAQKVKVIYPALPVYKEIYPETDASIISEKDLESTFNVLFVGKEPVGKGLYEVLEAWKRFVEESPHSQLNVVTQVDSQLSSAAKGIKNIRFFPPKFTTKELMTKLMIRSDVFAMPTHLDSFGMVYLESLSCQTPVIATKQFALPEMVKHNENGILLNHNPLFLDDPLAKIPKDPKKLTVDEEAFHQIVNGLLDNWRSLYRDRDKLSNLASRTLDDFRPGGRFSTEHRNKKLEELFFN